jgi:hypothetical protein
MGHDPQPLRQVMSNGGKSCHVLMCWLSCLGLAMLGSSHALVQLYADVVARPHAFVQLYADVVARPHAFVQLYADVVASPHVSAAQCSACGSLHRTAAATSICSSLPGLMIESRGRF